jgi:hypothetical protein
VTRSSSVLLCLRLDFLLNSDRVVVVVVGIDISVLEISKRVALPIMRKTILTIVIHMLLQSY